MDLKNKAENFGKKVRFKDQNSVHDEFKGEQCLLGYTDSAVCIIPWEKRGDYHGMNYVTANIEAFEEVIDEKTEKALEARFLNHYKCECGHEWEDRWDCMCNDRCGVCNKEIEPYHSEELLDNDFPKACPLVLELEVASIPVDVLNILEGVIELTPTDPDGFMWLVRVETLIDTLDDSGLDEDYIDDFKDEWSEFVKKVQKTGAKYLFVNGRRAV